MNARIQVEHPVSEVVSSIDLIQEQICVASGEPLSISQDQVQLRGHAIECRINAEDPARGFAPTPGRLQVFSPPAGPWTRIDSHCSVGSQVSPFYDSLIAKLIVWAPDRARAIARMRRALAEFEVGGPGVRTTIDFHRRVMDHPAFQSGQYSTDFLDRHMLT